MTKSELDEIVFKRCCSIKCVMNISEGTDYTKNGTDYSREYINAAMFGYENQSQRKYDII